MFEYDEEYKDPTSRNFHQTVGPDGNKTELCLEGPATVVARLLNTRLKAVVKKSGAEWQMSNYTEDSKNYARQFTFKHDFYDNGVRHQFTETCTIIHTKRGEPVQKAIIIFECTPVKKSV